MARYLFGLFIGLSLGSVGAYSKTQRDASEIVIRNKSGKSIEHYEIVTSDKRLSFTHPFRGQFLRAELRVRLKDAWIIAHYGLSKDQSNYQLVSLIKLPFKTHHFTTSSDTHCEATPENLRTVNTVVAIASSEDQVARNARAFKAKRIFDESCHKVPFKEVVDKYYAGLARIYTPRDKPVKSGFLQCLKDHGFGVLGARVEESIRRLLEPASNPNELRLKFVCSDDLLRFGFDEGRPALRMSWLDDPTMIEEQMAHELMHVAGCRLHTVMNQAVACCRGEGKEEQAACIGSAGLALMEKQRIQQETATVQTEPNGHHLVSLKTNSTAPGDCTGRPDESLLDESDRRGERVLQLTAIEGLTDDNKVVIAGAPATIADTITTTHDDKTTISGAAGVKADASEAEQRLAQGTIVENIFGPSDPPRAPQMQVAAMPTAQRAPASVNLIPSSKYLSQQNSLDGIIKAFTPTGVEISPNNLLSRRVKPKENKQASNLFEDGIVLAAVSGLMEPEKPKTSSPVTAASAEPSFALVSLLKVAPNPFKQDELPEQADEVAPTGKPSGVVVANPARDSQSGATGVGVSMASNSPGRAVSMGSASTPVISQDAGTRILERVPEIELPITEIRRRLSDPEFVRRLKQAQVQIIDERLERYGAEKPKFAFSISSVSNRLVQIDPD